MATPPSLKKEKQQNGDRGKFFSEVRTFNLDSFQEEVINGKKVSTFSGISQLADAPNQNGRIYPRTLFEYVFKKPDFSSKLENRQLVGMLGHPADGVVDPSKISHVTTEVKILHNQPTAEGHIPVWTKNEILPTPEGNVLKTLFQSGINLGVSSRGWGDSYMEGANEVMEDDFDLCGWDVVTEPSVAIAYPTPDIVESFNRNAQKFATKVKGRLRQASKDEKTAYADIIGHMCTSGACQIDVKTRSTLESLQAQLVRPRATVGQKVPNKRSGGQKNMPAKANQSQTRLARIEASVTKRQKALESKNLKLQTANKTLSQTLGEQKRKLESADRVMRGLVAKGRERDKRMEAAKKLADAAIRRARSEARKAGQATASLEAAEKLINSAVIRERKVHTGRLSSHVESLVKKFPASQQGAVKAVIGEAKTVRHANKLYRNLKSVSAPAPRKRMAREDRRVVETLRKRKRSTTEGKEIRTSTGNTDLDLVRKVAERTGTLRVPRR